MASIIRIKRSSVSGNPTILAAGELAYSALQDNGSNGGDRLYIGMGTESNGNAANHVVIGGKFFTDRLSHTAGTLTANSALVVDGNSKIDVFNVDNLRLDGNTLSSTNTDGNILITPNGSGKTVVSNLYIGNDTVSLEDYVQGISGNQLVSTNGSININFDSESEFTDVQLNTEYTQDLVGAMFTGGTHSGLSVSYNDTSGVISLNVNDPTITISGDVDGSATMTNLGNVNIAVTLDTVNTNVGTFGSNTAVPVITVDGKGRVTAVSTSAISTSFTVAAETGTSQSFNNNNILTLGAGEGINTAVSALEGNVTVTISGEDASSSNKGIASFNATDFTVTSGNVTVNQERIQDIAGGMVSGNGATQNGITVGYDDTNGKFTFDVNDPTITISGDVDGSATMTNLGDVNIAVTLDTVNTNVGSFGSSTAIPVVTVDGKGRVTAVSTAAISSSFTLAADTGTAETFNNGETLTFTGGEGIDTAVSNNTITISAEDASTTNKGIASFNSASFNVIGGSVTIKAGGVSNSQLANSSVTIGTTSVSLGGTSTSLAGLTELTVDNLNLNSNTISATNTDGNIVLAPSGNGTVDVSGKRITGLATPVADTDAATKLYVDTVAAEGLHVQEGVDVATTNTLAAISSGTVTYNNGTLGVGATLTTTGVFTTIDGVVLTPNPTMDHNLGGRVLVKNEVNRTHNGIYYLTANNVLTRDPLFDSDAEIEGGDFVFVVGGTLNGGTGWVQINTVNIIGTDEIIWEQFSGAGTYTAGSGLALTGTEFSINIATDGGLEVSGSNAIQVKSSIAGNGLSYNSGVLAVGGTTNRISVGTDSIDIASTYVGQTSITTLGTITTGTWSADAIAATKGGTGQSTYSAGDLLYASGTNTLSKLTKPSSSTSLLKMTATGVPSWTSLSDTGITGVGTITTGTWSADAIAATKGGTGITTYATGDILYASATNTLTKLSAGLEGQVLQINASGVPVWADIDGGTY